MIDHTLEIRSINAFVAVCDVEKFVSIAILLER